MRRTRLLGDIIKTFRMDGKGCHIYSLYTVTILNCRHKLQGLRNHCKLVINRREAPLCCIRYDLFIIKMSVFQSVYCCKIECRKKMEIIKGKKRKYLSFINAYFWIETWLILNNLLKFLLIFSSTRRWGCCIKKKK